MTGLNTNPTNGASGCFRHDGLEKRGVSRRDETPHDSKYLAEATTGSLRLACSQELVSCCWSFFGKPGLLEDHVCEAVVRLDHRTLEEVTSLPNTPNVHVAKCGFPRTLRGDVADVLTKTRDERLVFGPPSRTIRTRTNLSRVKSARTAGGLGGR